MNARLGAAMDMIEAGDWLGALFRLDNAHRPDLIGHMLDLGMSGTPEFGEVLRACWGHDPDYAYLRVLIGSRRLIEVFRAQRFPHPFTEPVEVFRGENTLERPAPGPRSWTTSRERAAWFCGYSRSGRSMERGPVLWTATVRPADVLLWNDERNEQEVLPARVFNRRVLTADRAEIEALAAACREQGGAS